MSNQLYNQLGQPAASCKQTSIQLSNRIDNRLDVCIHDYNLLSNRFDNRLYRAYKHSTGCHTGSNTLREQNRPVLNRGMLANVLYILLLNSLMSYLN